MRYQLSYTVKLWNGIKVYSDTLAARITTLQDTDFCSVTNAEEKNSFHHHRKMLIPIFTWRGVSVCSLYKVGAFYTIFLNPSANYLFFCKCCGWLHRNLYQNLITSAAVPLPHVLLMATCYEQSKIHHDLSLTDPHIGSLFSASPCTHMDRLNLQRLLCFFVIRPPA